jgi:hypothetical protein
MTMAYLGKVGGRPTYVVAGNVHKDDTFKDSARKTVVIDQVLVRGDMKLAVMRALRSKLPMIRVPAFYYIEKKYKQPDIVLVRE